MAVRTDPRCFITSGTGEGHHVPADGRLYVFDTREEHTAYNAGETHRVHLTIALASEERGYLA
jgi:Aspartyl/Asparaginyl beta-hydroxylase